MRKELKSSLPSTTTSMPTIQVGVPLPQIQSQLGLVTHPTLDNQHLSWQQLVTPLIAWRPRVVSYPLYPMWYNTVPPFVPVDLNLYSMYYFGIKGLDPLISRRKDINASGIIQTKPMPYVEQLE